MDVYIIDEEYHYAENVASALRFEGINATVFHDATAALTFFTKNPRLHEKDEKPVLLVDVSLAAGDDLHTFSREATDNFFQTGIVLVKALMSRCTNLCDQHNTILYTAHFATPLWGAIEEFCLLHKFNSWQKRPDSTVDDLVKIITEAAARRPTDLAGR